MCPVLLNVCVHKTCAECVLINMSTSRTTVKWKTVNDLNNFGAQDISIKLVRRKPKNVLQSICSFKRRITKNLYMIICHCLHWKAIIFSFSQSHSPTRFTHLMNLYISKPGPVHACIHLFAVFGFSQRFF